MDQINIVHRELTSEEMDHVNSGFDDLSMEQGLELESTEQISIVVLNGDRLIGCASGLAHKNGKRYSGWFYLTDLFIDKEFRNQGIGSKLLKELEKKIKTVQAHRVWLWTSGSAALRFYNRHGYTQYAEMENWYSDGSSRIGLRKTFI